MGMAQGFDIAASELGQNGWDPVAGLGMWSAFLIDVFATFASVVVILGVTHPRQERPAWQA